MSNTRTPKNNLYISKSFKDRIEINLANICKSKDDNFITGISFVTSSFQCELCHHRPCVYAYTVKNTSTNTKILVGSECVMHFTKGINIDLVEGLKKRIKSVTRKMRRYMKKNLTKEKYESISDNEKRENVIKLFMKQQTKESLSEESTKKVMLSSQEVLNILNYE